MVAVPISYDEQKKIYEFKEKKQVPGTSQDSEISSKQLRHTCDKVGIANQEVNPGGANLVIPAMLTNRQKGLPDIPAMLTTL